MGRFGLRWVVIGVRSQRGSLPMSRLGGRDGIKFWEWRFVRRSLSELPYFPDAIIHPNHINANSMKCHGKHLVIISSKFRLYFKLV